MVDGEVAVFDQVRNLRFINRFGEYVLRPRRCYKFLNRPGSFAPVDAKLGIEGCFGFSPLMTMLICMLGADESYERSASKLEALLGYAVSSTAVQRTTEKTGERIPDDPAELIDGAEHGQPCPLMVVEVDATTSPQISPQPGVTGRESLRAQTCWKECNLVVIEKRDGNEITDRWTGARYGPRKDFEPYAAQAGMQMGFMGAEQTLFIADGARHNWELAATHFPGAVQILDYYHAAEHLAEFCHLLPASDRHSQLRKWTKLLYHGEALQLIVDLQGAVWKLSDTDAGCKHITYFRNNQARMATGATEPLTGRSAAARWRDNASLSWAGASKATACAGGRTTTNASCAPASPCSTVTWKPTSSHARRSGARRLDHVNPLCRFWHCHPRSAAWK